MRKFGAPSWAAPWQTGSLGGPRLTGGGYDRFGGCRKITDLHLLSSGAPSWDRTNNLQIRSLMLYPIELWVLNKAPFFTSLGISPIVKAFQLKNSNCSGDKN
jgi:hypothetical protein